ncbi:GNAT family N-acetyltransferase [Brachybacterium phenoliresistens]|uniref:GNAT family acetyltraansferase n=1 Tax=Brachybacterium phenoliresistens TaxID=396014 RepID=Z9JPQ8_9MICO|nr:GNAT family N-acetyltransferase [Brachybacterium phenoliresistens]EWS79737.1 GNAT family acetyltraansferase [Brachybacterium phenoliresistens]
MTDQPQDAPTVRDNPAEQRFEIHVGETLAGLSAYRDLDIGSVRQRIFFHTEVDDAFAGQGLAGILTRAALTESVARGRRIVALCPYVKRWLDSHHDVDDAVDPVGPEHLRAVS